MQTVQNIVGDGDPSKATPSKSEPSGLRSWLRLRFRVKVRPDFDLFLSGSDYDGPDFDRKQLVTCPDSVSNSIVRGRTQTAG